ncbi:hypothetical protein [Streptomyces mirabilis]|jgi:hypothetical protein|uniref:DUF11 domain-containing protein n=1 Tax=Streptomyces mirabilis TaxID=68239 RepID=A0A1I2KMD3_9ACTN|nr:hypothetical protein [Streptomyces mirabilis]SFF66387.1 hypothetical protein SAMN02787118_110164 [Streptomyces mirabilis]
MNVARFRGSWAAVLVAVALVALLGGCDAASGEPRLKLDAPAVVYVSLDAARSHSSENDLSISQKLTGDGPADLSVTFDVRDLAGVAELKKGAERCRIARISQPVFACTMRTDQLNSASQLFHVVPAKGSEAGDSGVVRYTVRAPGVPAVTGRTTVVVGTPELKVSQPPDRRTVAPGGTVGVRVVVRNTGDVPARGVALRMEAKDGFSFDSTHRNCRYDGGSAWCPLSASEAVIAPGEAYALDAPERLRASADAMYPGVSCSASALARDYVAPPEIRARFTSGSGPDLRLVPVAGAADPAGPDLRVAVSNHADLAAVGATVKGPVGSRQKLRIGFRTQGPGSPRDAPVTVGFTVPAGTTVVESPYDPYRDEEVLDQDCRALGSDGAPLTEAASDKQPSARRYACTARGGKAGQLTLFPFTLRIEQDMAEGGGQVTVRGADAKRPNHDDRHGNDTAGVAVRIWPGPGWATASFYAVAAVGLVLLLLVAAVFRHRRRRSLSEK